MFSLVVSMNNSEYYELRSLELIQEAQLCAKAGKFLDYHDKIKQAISLLALARASNELPNGTAKAKAKKGA